MAIDGVGAQAHHIVAQGDRRAAELKGKLTEAGINKHSSANGIWAEAKEHSHLHTDKYYDKINSFFGGANTKAELEHALKEAKDWVKSTLE